MENHNIRFREVRRRARKRGGTGLAFGGSVMLAMAIPFVNLLAMPAAVAGATAMWVDLMKENAEV
jgi:CysZ protein